MFKIIANSTFFFELLAFVCGFYHYLKTSNKLVGRLAIFLGSIFLLDFGTRYIIKSEHISSILFTVTILFEFLFYYTLFSNAINNQKLKYFITTISILYLVFYCYASFSNNEEIIPNKYLYPIGVFILAIEILFYYYSYITSEHFIDYKNNIVFYISFGILIFYMGEMPILLLLDYLEKAQQINMTLLKSLMIVKFLLCNFLYIIYTYCFIKFLPLDESK